MTESTLFLPDDMVEVLVALHGAVAHFERLGFEALAAGRDSDPFTAAAATCLQVIADYWTNRDAFTWTLRAWDDAQVILDNPELYGARAVAMADADTLAIQAVVDACPELEWALLTTERRFSGM